MLCALILLAAVRSVIGQEHFGVQSNDGDVASSFASSMVFDREKKRVYVTGSTYGNFFQVGSEANKSHSDCFMGILQLPIRKGDTEPIWLRRVSVGDPAISEACSYIHTAMEEKDHRRIYLAGHSDGGKSGDDQSGSVVTGMLLDMAWYGSIQGGFAIDSHRVQYPLAMDTSSNDSSIFVASILSDSVAATKVVLGDDQGLQQDNTVAGGYSLPSGNFSVLVQRIQIMDPPGNVTVTNGLLDSETMDDHMSQVWAREIKSDASVQVSSMLNLDGEKIVIAGSWTDPDISFGGDNTSSLSPQDIFLSILNTTNGETVISRIMSRDEASSSDQILGLCRGKDTKAFYAVGRTNGDLYDNSTDFGPAIAPDPGSSQAFLVKIEVETLTLQWVFQLGALPLDLLPPQVHGLACSVTPDEELIYVAGNVKANSSISLDGKEAVSNSSGGDDMFVVQIRADNGSLVYARQLGTDQDDNIAGGEGVACDEDGNAIILGNTRGSMFRDKLPIGNGMASDVVVFSVDRITGSHGSLHTDSNNDTDVSFDAQEADNTDTNDSSIPPPDSFLPEKWMDDETTPPSTIDRIPDISFTENQQQPQQEEEQDSSKSSLRVGYIVGMVLAGSVAVISGLLLLASRRKRHRDKGSGQQYHPAADLNGRNRDSVTELNASRDVIRGQVRHHESQGDNDVYLMDEHYHGLNRFSETSSVSREITSNHEGQVDTMFQERERHSFQEELREDQFFDDDLGPHDNDEDIDSVVSMQGNNQSARRPSSAYEAMSWNALIEHVSQQIGLKNPPVAQEEQDTFLDEDRIIS